MKKVLQGLLIAAAMSLASLAQADVCSIAGVGGVDRYAPSGVTATGNNVAITVSPADKEGSRPAGFNAPFYNTQGCQVTLGDGTQGVGTTLSIVGGLNPDRDAGLWAVGVVGAVIKSYGILEMYNGLGNVLSVHGYQADGSWDDYGAVTGGSDNLYISLDGSGNWQYFVDGVLKDTVSADGSTSISAKIFNVHNEGVALTANYDGNYNVPEPGSLALMAAGAVGFITTRRRKGVLGTPA